MSDEQHAYADDALVYVNPETRTVIGEVEYSRKGTPKSLPYKSELGKDKWRKFFPWGTYRSMRNVFRLEGKRKEDEASLSMDEALPRLLNDSFLP